MAEPLSKEERADITSVPGARWPWKAVLRYEATVQALEARLASINAGIDAIERQAKMAEGNALGVMLSAAVTVLRDAAAHPTDETGQGEG